jgi:hypothetical protein
MTIRPTKYDLNGLGLPKPFKQHHGLAPRLALAAVYLGMPAVFYMALLLIYRSMT